MILILSVLFLSVSLVCYPIQSDDLFMYLAIARDFFKTGSFPIYDPYIFSLTQSKWTILHQWLGYFIFYGLYILGGFNLIIIMKTFLITLCLSGPGWFLKRWTELTIWASSVVLAIYAMSFRLMERTSLFSDFFLVMLLGILIREQRQPSRLKYAIPFIFLLWVNIHPSYPIGWALCGLFLICHYRRWRTRDYQRFITITLLSILVTLLNPKGLTGVLYPFQFAGNEAQVFRKYYFEWMPTLSPLYRFHIHTYFIFLLVSLNLILLFLTRKTKSYFEIVASFGFIAYGFYAIRFVPTLCMALVVLNSALSLKIKDFKFAKQVSFLLIASCFGFGLHYIFYGYETISGSRQFGLGLDKNVIPVEAAQIILQHPQIGNIFNSHMFGNYLVWAWEDKRKVFYHGFITDINFFLNEYAAFSQGPDQFQKQIDKYKISAFLLDRFKGNERVIQFLLQNSAWALAYKDDSSLIFLPRANKD